MVKLTKKLFIMISSIILFCTTQVNAQTYVNSGLYNNLIMPTGIQFYGWSSSTSYSVLGTGYQNGDEDIDGNKYDYYYTSGVSNDSNGFSLYFNLPESIPANTSLNLDFVFCSTSNANFYNGDITYGVGTGPASALTDNYVPNDIFIQSLGSLETASNTFSQCRRINILFTTPVSGTRFSIRIRSTSVANIGVLAFMGLNSINYGFDYSNQFNDISNQQQITNDKLDNIDNTLNNSAIDNPDFEEFEEYIAENGVITQLITLPVRLYTQILNNINSSCTPFSLGELFGHNLTMDCIEPSDFFGVALWNTIDILGSGLFIYAISKKMIAVFHQFTNLEEGDILD